LNDYCSEELKGFVPEFVKPVFESLHDRLLDARIGAHPF